jgi:acyl-CoA synthetase (AMP-forming)/AMP-acid ligase II
LPDVTLPSYRARNAGAEKELIVTGGYNVYLREIEEVLKGRPGVAEVGEKVTAAVVHDDPR